jgi:hypothetical protein
MNKSIDNAKHCYLCENKDFNVLTGMKCGLTQSVPEFNVKCSSIKFDIAYENKIKEVNIELDKVRRSKIPSYTNFYFFLGLSLVIILTGFLLGKYILDFGVISTVPLLIMGVGVGVLPLASGPINKYRNAIKIASNRKEELDEILRLYGISYTAEITVTKDLHDNEDYHIKLSYDRV